MGLEKLSLRGWISLLLGCNNAIFYSVGATHHRGVSVKSHRAYPWVGVVSINASKVSSSTLFTAWLSTVHGTTGTRLSRGGSAQVRLMFAWVEVGRVVLFGSYRMMPV